MKFYAHPDYSYSYAIVNSAYGEVYTYSANSGRIALKNALNRFDSILREAKREGKDVYLSLYNCNNGTLLAKECYEVPPILRKWGFKSEPEFEAAIGSLYDELTLTSEDTAKALRNM